MICCKSAQSLFKYEINQRCSNIAIIPIETTEKRVYLTWLQFSKLAESITETMCPDSFADIDISILGTCVLILNISYSDRRMWQKLPFTIFKRSTSCIAGNNEKCPSSRYGSSRQSSLSNEGEIQV